MGRVSSNGARISKPGKRFTANRTLSPLESNLVRSHGRKIGEVIHAYNAAHAALFVLFWRLAANAKYELAIDLWHTAKSDRSQRDMMEAVVRNTDNLNKTYKKALLWAIGSLNELSQFRNDAAHTDMIWYYDRLIPGLSTRKQIRERLQDLPFEQNWRKLKGDLIALSTYLGLIEISLMCDEPWPLTKRPILQLARSTSEQTQKQRRQAKKAARERQRKASPA